MALQILEKNGTFYVDGKINTSTSTSFKTYFEYNIGQNTNVIVNIDAVNEIDRDGLNAIKRLITIGFENNKMFSVVGNGCKEIYDDFYENLVA